MRTKQRKDFNPFPDLISEGEKYGLSNAQISQLRRYLNDKRMLRLITLAKFNEDAKAWLSALTGIVARVLSTDAHVAIWFDKKLEKPRNWILSKLTEVIPTHIDNIAARAIQVASDIRDNTILPLQEKVYDKVSDKMHDKYEYHSNATHLGQTFKELKDNAKIILRDSKSEADKDALKTLKQRKFETHILGGYHDDAGNFVDLSKFYKNASYRIITDKYIKKGKQNIAKQENNKQTTSTRTQEEGIFP